ncbi:MAG: SLBB domain-containing protein [Thermoguttaceae bacterium]|nr:SLBB domain-containing protein [Thermoguttaceae bacterium]
MAVAVAVVGCCRSPGVYRASRLPVEVLAPARMAEEPVNLANFAAPTIGRDTIQSGDVIEVSMVTDYARLSVTTTPVRVAEDGSVTVPLIGRVLVAGLRLQEAEQEIAAAGVARGVFLHPSVTVTMKQPRTNRITVVGAVKAPGVYDLPRGGSSVMAAIVAAGGLTNEAGTEVELRRTQPVGGASRAAPPASETGADAGAADRAQAGLMESVTLDLLAGAADPRACRDLDDGDVVHVVRRNVKPIYVLGLVKKPGEIPYPPNQEVRVLDALALAGGATNSIADDVTVIRRLPGEPRPVKIEVSLEAAKLGVENIQLAPGDTVVVEHTMASFALELLQTAFRIGVNVPFTLF